MKKKIIRYKSFRCFQLNDSGIKVILLLFIFLVTSVVGFAQEDANKEKPKPIKSRMSISVVQGEMDGIIINALVRAKINKRYTGLPDLDVNFAMTADTLEKELGMATTNKRGIAELIVPLEEVYVDSMDAFHFMVTFDGNDKFKGSDDDATYVLAGLTVEPYVEDSLKFLDVILESRGEPIADEDIYLFVESYINPLPIGEATTDEEGKVTFEFPGDLPGDHEGNVKVFAQLDDHSDFGTVVSRVKQDWGIPVAKRAESLPRALWSPNPPLWLLLSFVAILIFIWGHYFEVILKLVKLKKSSKKKEQLTESKN